MSLLPPKILDISSVVSLSGTTGNFTVSLPPIDAGYNRVSVVSASIPKTFYNIDSPYNTLILTEGKTNTTITVTPANYSFSSFAAALSALLTSASTIGATYTATPQLATGNIRLSSSLAAASSVTLPTSSNLYRNMGALYNSTITISSAAPWTSPNICLFSINVVVINSSLVKSSGASFTSGNILQVININNIPAFGAIDYENFNPLSNARDAVISQSANFTITDGDGTQLNFNGIPCNFSLMFSRFDDTNTLIRANMYLEHATQILHDHIASQPPAEPQAEANQAAT